MFDGLQAHFGSFTDYRKVVNPWGWAPNPDGTPVAFEMGRWGLEVMKEYLKEHDDGSQALSKMLEIQMTISLENGRASRKNRLSDEQIIARTVKEYRASLAKMPSFDDVTKLKPGIAKLVRNWWGVTRNGIAVPCTEENVLELLNVKGAITVEPYKGEDLGDGVAKWLRDESQEVQSYFVDFVDGATQVLSAAPAGLPAAGTPFPSANDAP